MWINVCFCASGIVKSLKRSKAKKKQNEVTNNKATRSD